MAAGAHFGCPKFTFGRISGHFRSIRNLFFLEIKIFVKYFYILDVQKSLSVAFLAISDQYETFFKLSVGHFECPKFTLDHISGHFRSIQIFLFLLIFFYKMAAGGYFGCLKITLDRISGHFRLIGHFGCPKFTWPFHLIFFNF